MGIFSKKQPKQLSGAITTTTTQNQGDYIRESFANTILDIIEDGAAIVNAQGEILYINVAATHELGYNNPNELVGMHFTEVLKMENSQGVALTPDQNPLFQAFKRGDSFRSRDYVVVSAQGVRIPEMITMRPIDEAKTKFAAIFRNISESLEEESEQAEFISTASHEMRTPVASIEGYLGLALNPSTATIDDRARQYLNEAHASAQHLGRLFKDLLDVTNLDDHRIKVHLVPSDLNELVHSIANSHIPACATKGLTFSFGTNDGSQIQQTAYSMVDPDFLREIIDNLISNAIKYTPEGGAIWVNVRGDDDKVLINVTDNGMGISPDNLDHIFQKFYRVDNSQTRTIGGTGLGLYIVKQRVEAMNGRVWVESAFGQGSTFFVSLPRLTTEEYERQHMVYLNTQAMTPQQAPDGLGKKAVLAADGFVMVSDSVKVPMVEAMKTAGVDVMATPEMQQQPQQPVQQEKLTDTVTDLSSDQLANLKAQFAQQMSGTGTNNSA